MKLLVALALVPAFGGPMRQLEDCAAGRCWGAKEAAPVRANLAVAPLQPLERAAPQREELQEHAEPPDYAVAGDSPAGRRMTLVMGGASGALAGAFIAALAGGPPLWGALAGAALVMGAIAFFRRRS